MIKEDISMKRSFISALSFILLLILLSSCNLNGTTTTTAPTEKNPVYWGKVSGVILENDAPLAGVTVASADRITTTDENGRYSIEVYDDGATVFFTKDGHITQSKTFGRSSFYRDEIDYSFIMFVSTRLIGRVVDPDGLPVSDALVSVGDQHTRTDSEGKYEFESVIGTSMVIIVSKGDKVARGAVFAEEMHSPTCEALDIVLK